MSESVFIVSPNALTERVMITGIPRYSLPKFNFLHRGREFPDTVYQTKGAPDSQESCKQAKTLWCLHLALFQLRASFRNKYSTSGSEVVFPQPHSRSLCCRFPRG